jgi:hypothetical protein
MGMQGIVRWTWQGAVMIGWDEEEFLAMDLFICASLTIPDELCRRLNYYPQNSLMHFFCESHFYV